MCGIVGYLGEDSPKEVIFNGLKSLEYRGYDSAGIAVLDNQSFKRVRAEGKLANLKEKLDKESFSGKIGIGHTRWATHGVPSERNAHPHKAGKTIIVHNGIIENYSELKATLAGREYTSETDSELIAHLVDDEIQAGKSLFDAVVAVIPRLEGAYSILAVSEEAPNEIIAFKNGPPLVVGHGKGSTVIASDIQAIMDYTHSVYFLQDDDIVKIDSEGYVVYNCEGEAKEWQETTIDWNPESVEKQGYAHYMLKEIFEQPRAVAQAMEPHIDLKEMEVRLNRVGFGLEDLNQRDKLDLNQDWQNTLANFAEIERVFVVACGTSFYAGMVGEYLLEQIAGLPVEVDVASEFRYRKPVIPKNSLVLVISQSGETADTLAALRLVKDQGAKILSICNVKNSSIDREADGHIYMNAGTEIGVASTKAFVSTLSLLNLLALAIGKAKDNLSKEKEKGFIEHLLACPSQMEKVLAYDKYFDQASKKLNTYKGFLYMGRGINYPIALEGALKLKELAYMHAEGYAAGEMKHGPLALIDEQMAVVMLVPKDRLYDKTISNLEEAKARGGQIISIGTGEDEKLQSLSQSYLALPDSHWTINPILEVIPLQLLSYHVAHSLGHNVDQPRNLAKSVTVE